jgi:hypothetical protein
MSEFKKKPTKLLSLVSDVSETLKNNISTSNIVIDLISIKPSLMYKSVPCGLNEFEKMIDLPSKKKFASAPTLFTKYNFDGKQLNN